MDLDSLAFYLKNGLFFMFLVGLSAFFTFFCRKYIKVMDFASERSLHRGKVPRSGGVAIVTSFFMGVAIYYFLRSEYFIAHNAFWGLLLSALIIAIVSFYDDVNEKGIAFRLMSQLIGVVILFVFGLSIRELTIPLIGRVHLGFYTYPITLLWVVGFTNAFNFMDGLDGLAAGCASIVMLGFTVITYYLDSVFVFHFSYMLAAVCIGFLFFNFPKSSIFMGDVGSAFIGFVVAALAILAANFDRSHTPFMVVPILFSHFILETFYTFIWRLFKEQPIHRPHKLHPYQLLFQMGVSSRKILALYYGMCVMLFSGSILYLKSGIEIKMTILLSIVILYSLYFIGVHRWARGYLKREMNI